MRFPRRSWNWGCSAKTRSTSCRWAATNSAFPASGTTIRRRTAATCQAIEAALTDGKGYQQKWGWRNVAPPIAELTDFTQFADAVGAYIRVSLEKSYRNQLQQLEAQIRWGKTPLTSCFFDGCIEQGHDMAEGTKYNFLSCGGIAFANAVDCLAAIREVVYEKKEATLAEVAAACRANFEGHERLRAKLLAAPKHGNDDPRLDDIVRLVERMRDEPMKEICRDPRDGSQFGNSHVVRSGAVRGGLSTPATPDGRLAGTPLASSVAASVGCEQTGPTAVLNSVCKLNSSESWQCGYQVNIRFHSGMIVDQSGTREVASHVERLFPAGRPGTADQRGQQRNAACGPEEPRAVPGSGGAGGRIQRVLRAAHAGVAARRDRQNGAPIMTTGRIFDIQRFSIHDGPGIRTTVFLKGCPLRCLWCGNPESIPSEPSLSYMDDKCIGCGACFDQCPQHALSPDAAGKAVVDRDRCKGSGDCAQVCDPKALEMVGRVVTSGEVLDVVLRDKAYYRTSGGGMTLSGGEPLMQPDFAESVARWKPKLAACIRPSRLRAMPCGAPSGRLFHWLTCGCSTTRKRIGNFTRSSLASPTT